jgi:hypothetical protein
MFGRNWLIPRLAALFLQCSTSAFAQTVGPDEAVNADGRVSQQLALTHMQKNAISNAVAQQRLHGVAAVPTAIRAAVGTPVSPAAELATLPAGMRTIVGERGANSPAATASASPSRARS